jgi:hypothetical protein
MTALPPLSSHEVLWRTAAVFVYMGVGEGAVVPHDHHARGRIDQIVQRVRVDPSVLTIPASTFSCRIYLQEVELHKHNGLHAICQGAFSGCTGLNGLQLSDGVESIGSRAFTECNFTKFRSPPLITTIPYGMLQDCRRLFSLELPENIILLERRALCHCHSLRNIALTSNTMVDSVNLWFDSAFINCSDLKLGPRQDDGY